MTVEQDPAPIVRLPDWDDRLSDYLARVIAKPFAYGEHDCLIHSANAVEALTGIDLAAAHRGRYRSRRTARAYLAGLGFRGPATLLSSILPGCPTAQARRGDIVMAHGMAGVCYGKVALMVGRQGDVDGLMRVPAAEWSRAWRVG